MIFNVSTNDYYSESRHSDIMEGYRYLVILFVFRVRLLRLFELPGVIILFAPHFEAYWTHFDNVWHLMKKSKVNCG